MINLARSLRLSMRAGIQSFVLAVTALLISMQSATAQPIDINAILKALNGGNAEDRRVNAAREKSFKGKQQERQNALNAMKRERQKQENISTQLENEFNRNEVEIVNLQEELKKELGDLKELFGVIQQTASEAQEEYKESLVSAQFPQRADQLQKMVAKMAELSQLVSIDEIEQLWFHLQNEMTEQGKIVQYDMPVYTAEVAKQATFLLSAEDDVDAVSNIAENEESPEETATNVVDNQDLAAQETEATIAAADKQDQNLYDSSLNKSLAELPSENRKITRIGAFNAVSGNDILRYQHNLGMVLLDRQMDARYVNASNSLQGASSGVTSFYLDPTKGALLSALVRKPSLIEKIHEGKIIGYAILALGAIAVLIALARIAMLAMVESSIKKQKSSDQVSTSNPLGRLRAAFVENPQLNVESMELVAMEAMQKESPSLNRGVMLIKIVAVVAPLLGLLGTVTGMIQTFQAITLFGAGDPQMMAGGISQALVTTVLGLVVAIPAVFLHWLASGRVQRIEETLEEQAAGLLAQRN